jgi:hypothetical protein
MRRVAVVAAIGVVGLIAGVGHASSQGEPPDPSSYTHGPDPACAFTWTSCVPELEAIRKVRAVCVLPTFRGVHYSGPRELATGWLGVGRFLGTVRVVTLCKDYSTGPDDPIRVETRSVRVFRLKGIKSHVALSYGGSSRTLLIALEAGCAFAKREALLVRCLRDA